MVEFVEDEDDAQKPQMLVDRSNKYFDYKEYYPPAKNQKEKTISQVKV